mmetsp:Transcript_10331/g.22264  ORF Transcript_10331/g.22264 Transcript_10331/m.22264 type:complete len:679 (-) Transcript_10331:59-2095(-)
MAGRGGGELEQPLLSPSSSPTPLGSLQPSQQGNGLQRPPSEENGSRYNADLSSSANFDVDMDVSINMSPQPRILERDGNFCQSRGRWSVNNKTRQRRGGMREQLPSGGGNFESDKATTPKCRNQPSLPTLCTRLIRSVSCRSFCDPVPPCCLKTSSYQPSGTRRCWDDWFHSLSYTPTCILMGWIFIAYFLTILVFAGFYLALNRAGGYFSHESKDGGGGGAALALSNSYVREGKFYRQITVGDGAIDQSYCGMDINNNMEALYFSLSTMATIGYGVSDYYFGDCWGPFILVLLQVFSALIFSSLAIGLLFQRMSRGQKRSRTIVFSDVAVIRKVRGVWYWMFRVAELRKRHIIGAKVRVFCVRHERCPATNCSSSDGGEKMVKHNVAAGNAMELETVYFVSHPLAILDGSRIPDLRSLDGQAKSGGSNISISDTSFEQSILMGLPHVVVHRIDETSPMMPPNPIWYDERGIPHGLSTNEQSVGEAANVTTTTSLTGSETSLGSRSDAKGDPENVAPQSLLAEAEEGRPTSVHQGSSPLEISYSIKNYSTPSQQDIIDFLRDRQTEIIVFLEGTCETTGMTLQARHSYCVEDIAFHKTFAPCVFPAEPAASGDRKWGFFARNKSKDDAHLVENDVEMHPAPSARSATLDIDFCRFHDLVPAPSNAESCPYVPSPIVRQ